MNKSIIFLKVRAKHFFAAQIRQFYEFAVFKQKKQAAGKTGDLP